MAATSFRFSRQADGVVHRRSRHSPPAVTVDVRLRPEAERAALITADAARTPAAPASTSRLDTEPDAFEVVLMFMLQRAEG
jgi:hypothetical protein